MTSQNPQDTNGSPVRRLGILYLISHCAIASLLGVGEVVLMMDLGWRRSTIESIGQTARREAFDESLCQSALSILANPDPSKRSQQIEALKMRIETDRGNSPAPTKARAGPGHDAATGLARILTHEASLHRNAALAAAESLVRELAVAGSATGTASPERTNTLIQTLVAQEGAYRRALADSVYKFETESLLQVDNIETIEFGLFVVVMVVLLLEGVYVYGSAMRKIQSYMAEVKRSNEELRTYAERLEQSNKELQDFASVASHDLQEPLRKIQAFSDRLRTKCAAALDDVGRDYLDRVQNAAKRMQTLINDLLTFCRITTKAQPFVPTDLKGATLEVISDLEARIEQVGGRVELEELPTVDADPLQMRQLMQNLIGNALKYHRPDVTPVVKVSSKPLPDESHELCQILVEDNGIGFDEVYTDRIFTIFQRLHGRTEYEGTGVGLAVCRKIAERHGGSITARSRLGEGSSFMVTLPVRQTKEAAHAAISS
jgi:signal transduction histidine kinase